MLPLLLAINQPPLLERPKPKPGPGASRSVQHLRELPGDYYAVGAVEQYLMQTGQVYFRGLTYDELHRIQQLRLRAQTLQLPLPG